MTSLKPTLRGRYAAHVLRKHVTEQFKSRPEHLVNIQATDIHHGLPKFQLNPPPSGAKPDGKPMGKVCIVGAGASGVYLAWMLTYLNIDYDLLEANNRIGGRVFTYDGFKDESDTCAHNYYDVGAMRIPDIASNQVTIDVMNFLDVPNDKYYLDNDTAPYYFDRKSIATAKASKNLEPLTKAFQEAVSALDKNFDDEFQKLISSGMDELSTREWLRTERYGHYAMDFKTIQMLETFNTGTGLFDQSLTESILDYADFPAGKNWYRIEGGMIKLVEAMHDQVIHKADLNTTVGAYKRNKNKVEVTYTDNVGNLRTKDYDAVFNSTTLGALGRIELNGLGSENQLTAIRSLSYDNAAKVAIKFKTAWWIEKGGMKKEDGSVAPGGVSGTDLPIRVVAYPAWTDKDPTDKPTVLIASYTWHQDAVRMGSLIQSSEKPPTTAPEKEEAVKLVLRNLATLFKERSAEITYDFLLDQVIDYHAYSWANDKYASGAFALFGPGQFTNLYPALFCPLKGSNNSVYIIGEHASAHHAWISGAFYSAATSLYGWLLGRGEKGVELASHLKFCGKLPFGGTLDEKDTSEPINEKSSADDAFHAQANGNKQQIGSLPDEMDEQVVYWMAQLAQSDPYE